MKEKKLIEPVRVESGWIALLRKLTENQTFVPKGSQPKSCRPGTYNFLVGLTKEQHSG